MAFCGVCAYNTSKSPVFILFIRIYIIETPNFNSTMNKNITNFVSQPVESFIKEASVYPLLTVEQENELVEHIKQGDEEAFLDLYNCNLRFVVSLAKQYQNRGKSMEELIGLVIKDLNLQREGLTHSEVSNSLHTQFGSSEQAFLHSLQILFLKRTYQISRRKRNVNWFQECPTNVKKRCLPDGSVLQTRQSHLKK